MPVEEGVADKGARYGCGCLTVALVPVPVFMFAEAITGKSLFATEDDPSEVPADFGTAVGGTIGVGIAFAIGFYFYRRIFAKHYSPKVLKVCLVLSFALMAFGALAPSK